MKRNDIQGLRALAVALVMADHLTGYPSGGFLGVDMFFVLSGFLITGLLVRERERTGSISFRHFYSRRARRILPLAALVLLVTIAASWALFRTERALSATIDSIWSLLFAANWRFAAAGTDYMAAGSATSPVQHFWSLAVEEQFYLAWPWLVLLAFWIATRFSRAPRLVLAAVFGLAIVISLLWAFHETEASRTTAYFSTFSRAWELGAGALLAVGVPVLLKLPSALRPVLAWLGIALLVVSVVVVDRESAFPAPWAIPAVLGTALVIAAGTGGAQRWLWPLTNPVSRYLGDISYSLYLWHFPIVIIGGTIFAAAGLTAEWIIGAVLLTLALSALSYRFVEDPIRRSNWLEPRSGPREPLPDHLVVGRVADGVLVVAVLGFIIASVVSAPRHDATEDQAAASVISEDVIAAALAEGINAPAWPAAFDNLPDATAPEWKQDDCLDVDDGNVDRCVYGDPGAENLAVLIGDSAGISWMPALRSGLVPAGWRIQTLTLGECPAIDVAVTRFTNDDFTATCSAHHDWATQQVERLHPDLVILGSAASTLLRLADGSTGDDVVAEWGTATRSTLSALRTVTDAPLVVLSSPPTMVNPQTCANRLNLPIDCVGSPEDTYDGMVAAEVEAAAAIEGSSQISTLSWFCTADGICPPVAGTSIATYSDTTHITAAWSTSLGGALMQRLAPILQ